MKDMQGNDLTVGDSVHVKVGNEWIVATILKISDGGIAVTGVPKNRNDQVGVTPDQVIFQAGVAFMQQPGSPQQCILKLAKDGTAGIVESAIKM